MIMLTVIKSILATLKQYSLDSLMYLVVFLSPLGPILATVGVLIFSDFVTGVWKAKKNGEGISSKKMSLTASKMALYLLVIILGYAVQSYIITYIPFVHIISGFIALIELKSISENIFEITGLNIWNALKTILNRKAKDLSDSVEESNKTT